MQITVRVFPGAKRDQVAQISSDSFQVRTTAVAKDNQANLAMIKLLADYLGIKKSQLLIISGEKNKNKILQILKH